MKFEDDANYWRDVIAACDKQLLTTLHCRINANKNFHRCQKKKLSSTEIDEFNLLFLEAIIKRVDSLGYSEAQANQFVKMWQIIFAVSRKKKS